MSLHFPARRLAQTARSGYLLPYTQQRSASWFNWGGSSKKKSPLSEELEKREQQKKIFDKMADRTAGESVFDEEIKKVDETSKATPTEGGAAAYSGPSRAKEHMARALDPDPRWRIRWQRKKVMQMVRSGGKVTKEQHIKMTEKEILQKSENLNTSTKKLMFLSRQIQGKTLDEALTQMRYSKKKTASEVSYVLKEARDRAIVSRGMGLGQVNGQLLDKPRQIQDKEGKWLEVSDPTRLYIDQAWVGKGPPRGMRIQYHARGRMSRMMKPSAHLTVILKEEKTRLRQYDDKLKKEAKAKPWVHLPNRPVTAQRPYYTW
ncbi:54S ribosomal protein L22, mitochondrial [Pestalotiopsis sp. 9143b]|nr:54S ribosomal protein L22, mitochondrial [Pestalotiopsis sp. 9143b]